MAIKGRLTIMVNTIMVPLANILNTEVDHSVFITANQITLALTVALTMIT